MLMAFLQEAQRRTKTGNNSNDRKLVKSLIYKKACKKQQLLLQTPCRSCEGLSHTD